MSNEADHQLHRDVGRLEGDVKAIDSRVRDMQEKVDEMHRLLMQAQGGWRVMVMVGSASAAIGALVAKMIGLVWR